MTWWALAWSQITFARPLCSSGDLKASSEKCLYESWCESWRYDVRSCLVYFYLLSVCSGWSLTNVLVQVLSSVTGVFLLRLKPCWMQMEPDMCSNTWLIKDASSSSEVSDSALWLVWLPLSVLFLCNDGHLTSLKETCLRKESPVSVINKLLN